MNAKTGRNLPCPCGSGKKFKLCCMPGHGATALSGEVHYDEAIALHARGDLESAKARFQAALALEPNFVEALVNLGNVLLDTHEPKVAIDCFTKALALRPDFVDVRVNLGLAQQAAGRCGDAFESYLVVLAQGRSGTLVLNNLGLAQFEAGFEEEALVTMRRALLLDLQSIGILGSAVEVMRKCGRTTEAAGLLRAALGRAAGITRPTAFAGQRP